MNPRIPWVLGLWLLLVPFVLAGDAGASERSLALGDVVRLHQAGVSEEIILSEIIVTESTFALDVDDILRIREAGLSDRLIKFLIDTGLPSEEVDDSAYESTYDSPGLLDDSGYGDDWDADYEYGSDEYADSEEWVNVIEEDTRPEVTYHVSLAWDYPGWYYDSYWDDYWYWDFHWAPYRVSWVYGYGCWMPTWYTARSAWCWPGWGYRSWYASSWGGHYWHGRPYWAWNGYHRGYWDGYHDGSGWYDPHYGSHGWDGSQYKRKTRNVGGSKSGPLIAKGGRLDVPVGGRVPTKDRGPGVRPDRGKPRKGDVILVDHRDGRGKGDDLRRPVRSGGKTPLLTDRPVGGGRKPVLGGSDRNVDSRRPTRIGKPTAEKPDRLVPPKKPPTRKPVRTPTRSRVRDESPTKPNVSPPPKRPDPPSRDAPRVQPPPKPKDDRRPTSPPKVKSKPTPKRPEPKKPSTRSSKPAPKKPKISAPSRSGGSARPKISAPKSPSRKSSPQKPAPSRPKPKKPKRR